jgi:protein-S-isoprenylcysteine O-methyltransferase Ste14
MPCVTAAKPSPILWSKGADLSFWKRIRGGRLIWTLLVTFYFVNFFRTMFSDALPGQALIPIIFAVAFTVWMAIEYYFESPFFQSGVVQPSQLWKSLFALFYYPFLGYCAADYVWNRWTQMGPLSPYVNIFGILVFALGSALRFETLATLVRSSENRLVRSGFFRFSRHPRYLATLLQVLAVPLVFSSWSGILLALAIGLPLTLVEIRYEEARLSARFPQDYSEYRKAVPALLPRFRKS